MRNKHVAFAGLVLATAAVFTAAAIPEYYNFRFCWDGFFLYDTLRNFVDRGSLWQGPAWGYTLGIHSYWTLYLLTPFVALFRSPIVMLMASIASHFISSFLIYLIAFRRFNDRLVASLFGVLYMVSRIGFGVVFGRDQLFQPDYMMPVFLLSMVYVLSRGYGAGDAGTSPPRLSNWFYVFWMLFLATKEEYIPVGVAVFAWLAFDDVFLQGKRVLTGRRALVISGAIFLLVAVVDAFTLRHFNAGHDFLTNTTNQPSPLLLAARADIRAAIYKTLLEILLPLSPVIVGAFIVARPRARLYLALSLLAFVFFRVMGSDLLIYYPPAPLIHWANIIIPPTLTASLVVALAHGKKMTKPYRAFLASVLLFGIALSLTSILYYPTAKGGFTSLVLKSGLAGYIKPLPPDGFSQQLIAISKSLPPPDRKRLETVCVPPYGQWPFAAERSHIGYNTLLATPEMLDGRLRQVDWIIVPKEALEGLSVLVQGRPVYYTTEDFILFGR